ncbi:DUF3527 domain-containing protein [Tanacetum coccineum]
MFAQLGWESIKRIRGVLYIKSSSEVGKMNNISKKEVQGRKKIEFSRSGDPIPFEIFDSLCNSDEDDAPLASFSSSFVKMSLNSMIKQEDQESSSLHLPKSLSSRLEQPHSPTRSEDDSSKAKLVNADNSMVTEFVLYDLAHSRRSGSPIPQKTPESKESTGKSTWFCHSDESHGTSPLLDRGRLGGGCDCGGWDMGCPLIVLGNSDIQKAKVCKQSVELFLKGTKEDTPAITMKMTTEGHTGSSDIVDQNNDRERLQCDSMRVFAEDEVKHLIEVMAEEDKRKPSKNEITLIPHQSTIFSNVSCIIFKRELAQRFKVFAMLTA